MMKPHGAYSDSEAASYDEDRAGELLWRLENSYVERLLERMPGASILDVPVGTGRFFPLYPGRRVLGVDASDAMLEQARRKGERVPGLKLTLARAGIDALPAADRDYDLVICWRVLHLLPPELLRPAFKEMARVCRGQVCAQSYVPDTPGRRTAARVWRWLRRLGLPFRGKRALTPWSHIRTYSHDAQSILSAAQEAGLVLADEHLIGRYEGTRVLAMTWSAASKRRSRVELGSIPSGRYSRWGVAAATLREWVFHIVVMRSP